jgi:cellulose biosynthesis protein BcsQ
LGVKVLAVDLDPQANLTAAFRGPGASEIVRDLKIDDPTSSLGQTISDGLVLLSSDLMLSPHEEELAVQWQGALSGNGNAFGALAPRLRLMTNLSSNNEAQLILVDLGPNLSAINRAGLIFRSHCSSTSTR